MKWKLYWSQEGGANVSCLSLPSRITPVSFPKHSLQYRNVNSVHVVYATYFPETSNTKPSPIVSQPPRDKDRWLNARAYWLRSAAVGSEPMTKWLCNQATEVPQQAAVLLLRAVSTAALISSAARRNINIFDALASRNSNL